MILQSHETQSQIQDSHQQLSPEQFDLSKFIPPPNPITTKTFSIKQNNQISNIRRNHLYRSSKLLQSQLKDNQQESLDNFYNKQFLIFQKCNNKKIKQRNGIKYASSIFIDNVDELWDKTKYIGMIKNNQQIEFDSNYQSTNLFQVYKTGDRQFDVILQNDINTTGYAQWFNFKVKNKQKNTIIKLNLVNMYKSTSLYQKGMKPLALSKFQGKKWQRNTFQVQYYENQIPTQRDSSRYYYTLSFCYEFKYQQDQVQFCHFFPYTSLDCQNFLSNINGSSKIRIKNLGNSSLKKPIPLIQIFSQSNNTSSKFKKAIVIIGRQHSGQTQSSFLIQQLVYSLLTSCNQSQFILQKFDVFVCPMLNIDGVYLGNYRTNAYGYDLNRYWHTDNQLKIPQVFYFKKFINNLKKRNKISLILDLHGHSKKLNSFFYCNPFGKNYMMLPFVASKMCDMIRFKSCTFNEQKSEKSKTARAILGNLLKDTTYIYTYEVSFCGYKKHNRIFPYSLQNLKQLGKTLVSSIYKVFMQEIKEQITLKQSIFFKEINKQLSCLTQNYFQKQSGSDSEAENLTITEDFEKLSAVIKNQKQNKISIKINHQNDCHLKNVGIQVELFPGNQINLNSSQVLIYIKEGEYQQNQITDIKLNQKDYQLSPSKLSPISGSKSYRSPKSKQILMNRQAKKKQQEAFYHLAYDSHFQTKNNFYFHSAKTNPTNTSRKQFLLQKLRIFGQTFIDNVQPDEKVKLKGSRSIGVQFPDSPKSKQKFTLDSIISKNNSQKMGNYYNSSLKNEQKNRMQSNKKSDKWQKNKQLKRPYSKKKALSLMFNKPRIEDIIMFNQKYIERQQIYQQSQKNDKDSFMIKISKSPIVRIQKYTSLNKIIGNQIKQRQSIYDNISKLKNNITALKRQYSDKLPQIDPYTRFENT